jgi:hypothetical protein
MSQPISGQPMDFTCDEVDHNRHDPAFIPCQRVELADGSVEIHLGYELGLRWTYRFITAHVAPDGFVVETLDDVRAFSAAQARSERRLSDAATSGLVHDPALRFPAPVHTPPSPAPQL